jgi:hypothetical protein
MSSPFGILRSLEVFGNGVVDGQFDLSDLCEMVHLISLRRNGKVDFDEEAMSFGVCRSGKESRVKQ